MSRQSSSHLSPDTQPAAPLGMLRRLRHNNSSTTTTTTASLATIIQVIRLGSRNDRQLVWVFFFRFSRGCSESTFPAPWEPHRAQCSQIVGMFEKVSFPGSMVLTVNTWETARRVRNLSAALRYAGQGRVDQAPSKYPSSLYTACLNGPQILTPLQYFL